MIQKIKEYLTQTRAAAVQSLCDFLRIPSIATQPEHAKDVVAAARWVADYFTRMGLKPEIWETPGHPAVFAEVRAESTNAPTILIYGHHDVQPTGDLAKWTSAPFEPRIDSTGRIFARGSADDKGQVF